MLWKYCTQYCSKFGKQQWPQDWKKSVLIPISKKGNAKDCSNYCTIALISNASNVHNSPSQGSAIHELWTFTCSSWFLKRQRNRSSNCQHLLDHQKSKRVPEKHLFLLDVYAKAFVHVDHNKLWKIHAFELWCWRRLLRVPWTTRRSNQSILK